METNSRQPLFERVELRHLSLSNRVVMAPLTRMRAANAALAPTEAHARYYAQRASAGLIITEGVFITPEAVGWADVPGIWSKEQIAGWRQTTDAVHANGGHIMVQLWHTGALSHPDFFRGALPVSASAVNPLQESVTSGGNKPTVVPRPMTKNEIRQTVADFAQAARNARDAGFDGVQIQGGFHYLFGQFHSATINRRNDEYGGSVENRARFLLETVEAVADAIGPERVGVKAGPATLETGAFVSTQETLPTYEHIARQLDRFALSHLLLMGQMADLSKTPLAELAGDGMFHHFRSLYHGNIIANVDMSRDRANQLIEAGLANLVAFGRPYIANPDLVARLVSGAELALPNPKAIYGPTEQGYTDYPALQLVAA